MSNPQRFNVLNKRPEKIGQALLAVLLALCGATFMIGVDTTIVGVALPEIGRSLGAGNTALTWVVVGYTVTFGSLMLATGHLGDRFGYRRLFLIGVSIFCFASAACGVAPGIWMLQVARLFQGIAAALINSTAMALLATTFAGQLQLRAFAIWGAVMGSSFAVGPVLGGLLVNGPGWRWMFLVNVPVCIAVGTVVALYGRRSAGDPARTLDVVGQVTASAFFAFLIGALVLLGGVSKHGTLPAVGCLAGAIITLILFVVRQRHKPGLLDFSMFRQLNFVGITLLPIFYSVSFWALLVILPQYYETSLKMPPALAGLSMVPLTGGLTTVPLILGRVKARLDTRAVFVIGMLGILVGDVSLAFAVVHNDYAMLVPGLVLSGATSGLMNPEVARTAMRLVDSRRSGMASGLTSTMRQIGFGAGVASFGVLAGHGGDAGSFTSVSMQTVLFVAAAMAAGGLAIAVLTPGLESSPR